MTEPITARQFHLDADPSAVQGFLVVPDAAGNEVDISTTAGRD